MLGVFYFWERAVGTYGLVSCYTPGKHLNPEEYGVSDALRLKILARKAVRTKSLKELQAISNILWSPCLI
jgi:hypothetical protein